MAILAVFIGGGLGAVLRFGVMQASLALFGASFLWGTLIANISGSFLLGFMWVIFENHLTQSPHMQLFVTLGLLGGFTTFSTFSLEAVLLWQSGHIIGALIYCLASVFLSIAALVAGLWLSQSLI